MDSTSTFTLSSSTSYSAASHGALVVSTRAMTGFARPERLGTAAPAAPVAAAGKLASGLGLGDGSWSAAAKLPMSPSSLADAEGGTLAVRSAAAGGASS